MDPRNEMTSFYAGTDNNCGAWPGNEIIVALMRGHCCRGRGPVVRLALLQLHQSAEVKALAGGDAGWGFPHSSDGAVGIGGGTRESNACG